MRYISPAKLVALSILASTAMFGQFTISNYQVVSQQVGSTTTTYAYTAQVTNTGVAVGGVTASAGSMNPFNLRIVPSANVLTFGPVAANGSATSLNTFSVIIPNGTAFSSTNISWTYTSSPVGPIANAGPNQAATPGQTITLNGGGSTNPSGQGTLTYQWAFASRPPGSSTVLQNQTNVISSFIVDVTGTFVIQLTVSNGSESSSATVTVNSSTDTPPVANAGPNQTVTTLPATITLNGTGSSDTDGKQLTYSWSLTTVPAGSTATLSSTTAASPTFVADKDGTYVATLVVNDQILNSKPSTVTISENTPPVANAGPNQTLVPIGSTVTLNGSGSTDLDGDKLTYSWSLLNAPSGSKAALSSTTVVNPTFTADLPGTYTAQLIVYDNLVPSTPATVQITTNQPLPPVANAGSNQSVGAPATVSLNGAGSTDPQNLQLTYSWSLTTKPSGSNASLTGATTATPTFLADLPGTYVAQLIVSDGYGSSNPALAGSTVTISSSAQLPKANAGTAQTVAVGGTVTLNGSGSSDPQNATPLTYSWSLTSAPSGSLAVLKNSSTATPTFVADMAGAYVAQLIVTDTLNLASSPATVMITATSVPSIILQSGVQVSVGGQGTVNLSLSAPSNSSLFVNVVSNNTSNVTVGTSTYVIPANSTGPIAVKVNGVGFGSATITATASGTAYLPASTTVLSTDIATFSPNAVTINGETTNRGASFLLLSSTAQTAVTFNLSSSNPSVATVPATVVINAGSSSNNVAVTSVSGGTAVITATPSSTSLGIAPATLNVTVNAVEITTTQLPAAIIGAPYLTVSSQPVQLTASSGTAPYTWKLAAGSILPPNLTLSAAGVIGGSPATTSQPSVTPITFIVTDSSSPAQTASATISVQVVAGTPHTIATNAGTTPQTTADTTAFATPLAVTVTDINNFLVPNAVVTFSITAGAGGASGTFPGAAVTATATTNSAGVATAPALTANGTLGSFTVSASVAPVAAPNPQPTPVTFTLTNNVGPAATIAATGGTPQNTTEQTPFTNPLVVLVKDAGGNPVTSAVVTFSVPPSTGASATFTGSVNAATTNAQGVATSNQVVAGSIAGAYAVTAASGAATGASFALTNNVGVPATIVLPVPSPASIGINQNFPALVATVKDSGGNGVPGIAVNFAATTGTFGQTATFAPNPSTTGANGSVTVTATANSKAGPAYSVTATATGGSNPQTSISLTNVSGPAATIVVNGGTSPQTVGDGAAFAPLSVFVTDAGGNPVNNQSVTFTIATAPAGSASASFAGGLATTTASTNSSGVATTASILTANSVVGGPYTVTATVTGSSPAVSVPFALTNKVGLPTTIAVSGTVPPSVAINTAFAALVVKVTDQGGNVVPGASVTFTAPSTGASGTFPGPANTSVVSTLSTGLATAATYTANSTAGADTVTASVTGVSGTISTNILLTNLPGSVTTLTLNGAAPTPVSVLTQFGSPLSVLAKDAGGNVVPGVGITFTMVPAANGASATPATTTATTGANGIATTSAAPTANNVAGTYSVTAAVTATPAISTSIALTNNPGPPASIAATGGTGGSVQVTNAFPALAVTVKDAAGDVLPGVNVTFTAPTSQTVPSGTFGGTATTITVQTNSLGVASATFTANTKAGPITVTATAAGGTNPATSFSLTSTPLAASTVTAAPSGTPQSAAINAAFANPLLVTVADQYGNPVIGQTVAFAALGTTANAILSTPAATNASGQTSVTATANSKAGAYTVTATIAGVSATFNLTNNPGPAANIVVNSGSGQSAGILTPYANPFVVTVTDAGGNFVAANTSVVFAAPNTTTSASGTFSTGTSYTATTNASGVATSLILTANKVMGGFFVGVSAPTGTAQQQTISLTNLPGPPATITGGSSQSAQVTQPFGTALTVTVKDSQGNFVVSGTPVIFTATTATGGATGTFSTGAAATATTNASGVATAPAFTAGTVTGSYAVGVTSGSATLATPFAMTNTPGPAANVAISSGSPQSVTVNIGGATTSKYAALAVIVKDAQGNLVAAGTPVTFQAPAVAAGVATGVFATNPITETTNTSGIATVPANTLVAGTVAGTFSLTVTSGTGTVQFPLTNTAGTAFSIAATSGGGQIATVKQAFTNPLVATVRDANGNPVNGAIVTFAPPTSGASGTFATSNSVTTNPSGVATSNVFTANGTASPQATPTYNVTASVSGVSSPAMFALTNQAGPPNSITPVASTNSQSVAVNTAFAPLAVTVVDVGGNFVSGAPVTFTAPAQSGASGTFAGSVNTATTNALGVATSTVFTANTVAGTNYTVTATATGGTNPSTPFTLTNKPGAAFQIVPTTGNNQNVPINNKFTLAATVQDQFGNTVTTPAVIVSFTGPTVTTAAGVVGAQAALTSNGIATVPTLQANLKIGTYTVTASSNGSSLLQAQFTINNTTGLPALLTAVSGSGQTAQVPSQYAAPLVVSVTDIGSNPIPNAIVTFTAPVQGASGTFSSAALTGVNGQTQVNFTANTLAGVVSISATTSNGSGGTVTLSPSFSLTNKAGQAAKITTTGVTSQSAYPNTEFASRLQAVVTDQYSNVIVGQTVIFSNPPSGNAKAVFGDDPTGSTSTAVTQSNGVASSLPITAGAISGTYTVTANTYPTTVSPGASYTLTNSTSQTPPTATITMTAATGATLNVGQNMMIPIQVTVSPQPTSQIQVTATTDGVNLMLGLTTPVQTEQVPVPGSSTPAASVSVDIYVQALGNTGTFPITFDMPGYTSFTGSVTVVPSGFVLVDSSAGDSVPPTITQFSTYVGESTGLTVYPVQSNSSGSFTTPYTLGTIRGGITSPITVPLSVTGGNPLPGTIPTASFGANSQSANVSFTGTNVGGGSILLGTPSGFQTPGSYQSLGVTVAAESIVAQPLTIGNNLETNTTFTLNGVAPTATCPQAGFDLFTVTATSPILSNSLSGATSSSIQVPVVCGQSTSATFYVQAVGVTVGQQGLSYTVSGQGFPSSTGAITVGKSGFAIAYNQTTPSSGQFFRVTAGVPINNTLTVYSYLLDSSGNPQTQQVLAANYNGGGGISIALASDNTNVGTVASPVAIASGTGSANTTFNPLAGPTATQLANGITYATANVSISPNPPSGFTQVLNDATIQAQVSDPGFSVSCAGPLGQFLQTNCSVSVGPILSAPLQVSLTLTGNILLSANGTDSGSPTGITVTIPAGTNQGPTFFAYGLGSSGTATVTASSVPGQSGTAYNPSTSQPFTLANSGVAIAGNFSGFTPELETSASDTGAGQPPFTVEVGVLNSDGSFGGEEAVMGQSSVSVNLNLNGPGTLGQSQVTIGAGQAAASVSYTPPSTVPSPNTATISLTGSPSGVSGTSSQNSLEVVIGQ